MCNAKPGLRCTPHARTTLARVQTQYADAVTRYDTVKNGRNETEKSQRLRDVDELHGSLSDAERDFYSSTGGIEELRSAAENLAQDSDERALVESRLALAEYDRATQQLASRIYHRGRSNIQESVFTEYAAACEKEKSEAAIAADQMNNDATGTVAAAAIHRASEARADRARFEERLRRETAGIQTGLVPTKVGDLSEDELVGQYVPLSPADFGRAHEYLPYGAYGKITEAKRDASGQTQVCIEASQWKTLAPAEKVGVAVADWKKSLHAMMSA